MEWIEYGVRRPKPLTGVIPSRSEEEAERTVEHLETVSSHKGWKVVQRVHHVEEWSE